MLESAFTKNEQRSFTKLPRPNTGDMIWISRCLVRQRIVFAAAVFVMFTFFRPLICGSFALLVSSTRKKEWLWLLRQDEKSRLLRGSINHTAFQFHSRKKEHCDDRQIRFFIHRQSIFRKT